MRSPKMPVGRASLTIGVLCLAVAQVWAQIGGKTAADGVFTIDNAESLNLVASGVQRDWISDFVQGGGLTALDLTAGGLTLAPQQTPIGALRFVVPSEFGYINKSFGVPMPSVAGASTLTNPGNITSFGQLRLLAQYTPAISGISFSVIIQCYPEITCPPGETGPCYPEVFYSFTPAEGTAFQEVTIDLSQPTTIDAPSTLTLQDLLSQTRFLSIYAYASVGVIPKTLVLDVDDIQLVPPASADVRRWQYYE